MGIYGYLPIPMDGNALNPLFSLRIGFSNPFPRDKIMHTSSCGEHRASHQYWWGSVYKYSLQKRKLSVYVYLLDNSQRDPFYPQALGKVWKCRYLLCLQHRALQSTHTLLWFSIFFHFCLFEILIPSVPPHHRALQSTHTFIQTKNQKLIPKLGLLERTDYVLAQLREALKKQARKLQATLEVCNPKLSLTDSLTHRGKV